LDRTALQQGATYRGASAGTDWLALPEFEASWRGIVGSSGTATFAIVAENHSMLGTADTDGVLQQRLKDALEVECRPADGLEYLSRGRLLPQRFAQLLRARLYLVEQSRVLDRDHCLIRKNL
jgi:hypothetical protein